MKTLRGDKPDHLREIVGLLLAGTPVALPTETVYGLAADALNPNAVRSIFEIKGRPANDPLIVHVSDFTEIDRIAFVPRELERLADSFWPGPLTVILRKKEIVPDIVTSGLPSVAIRVPAHPLFLKILKIANRPLAAPSANPFGYVSPTRAEHVVSSFGSLGPVVLDGGPTDHGIESTIISLVDTDNPEILRPGPLLKEDLSKILGKSVGSPPKSSESVCEAPGNFTSHYSPGVRLQLHPDRASIQSAIASCKTPNKTGVLLLKRPCESENWHAETKLLWLSEKGDLNKVASRLYDAMRKMDDDPRLEIVHCETPKEEGIGTAINDRLRRAASRD